MTISTQVQEQTGEVSGTLKAIKYHKDNYLIGVFSAPDSELADERGEIKAKGNMIAPQIGMQYSLHGHMTDESRWGPTFIFQDYETHYPTDADAVQQYLRENCRFIGPAIARRITEEFGENALATCKAEPALVAEKIKGLTPKRAEEIAAVLRSNEKNEHTQIQLKKIFQGTKVSSFAQNLIVVEYGGEVIEKINENPFDLTRFNGIGFTRADLVARNVGFPADSPWRIRAGIKHAIAEAAAGEGHTYLFIGQLVERSRDLLNVSDRLIEAVLTRMIQLEELVADPGEGAGAKVSLCEYFSKEKYIAERILAMLRVEVVAPDNGVDLAGLADDQRHALSAAIIRNVFILTGAPGTGKTYTVRRIISALSGANVALAAPTGKAAARLRDLTGYPTQTIHRLLSPAFQDGRFYFSHNQNNPLPNNLVIIDEASMVDVSLFFSLISALRNNTRLILVGDTYQLPAVGAGNVLRDLLAAGVPSVELKEIKRQDAGLIVRNCHAIKAAQMLRWENSLESDFFLVQTEDPDKIRASVLDLAASDRIKKQFGADPLREVQVLSPLREKTDLSCNALNLALQGRLNVANRPEDPDKPANRLWPGDKVIQLKNDYDLGIINGDIGYVAEVREKKLVIEFESPARRVEVSRFKNDLGLAYALTVHKYQGSEVPVVIIPIHRCFGPLIMQRNWIYTAISRAQRACILIGQVEEIRKMIGRNKQIRRQTHLEGMLRDAQK